MAASLAKGRTRLFNAAQEPEVTDLAACLIGMGAEIHGLGSDCLTIYGQPHLRGYEHRIIPDRIESGTYAMAAAMTDGELELVGARRDHMESVIDCLGDAGIDVTDTNRENRFMHVPELSRMGADIHVDGAVAEVHGRARLTGAPVMATDLRASFSLVLAGLFADGETLISRVYHLDRGYEAVESKLMACGAVIERIK